MVPRGTQQKLLHLAVAARRQPPSPKIPICRHSLPLRLSIWSPLHEVRRSFASSCPLRQQEPLASPATFPTITPKQWQESPPPPPPPPPKPRKIRRILFNLTFVAIGSLIGGALRHILDPLPIPPADSPKEAATRAVLHRKASELSVVRKLEASPRWVSWDAYSPLPESQKQHHLAASSLASTAALGGYQRVWQERDTGDVVVLVYFGRAATGWPTVVHGGALATVVDEACGRVAMARLGDYGKEEEEEEGQRDTPARPVVTASLKLKYEARSPADNFYVVRARAKTDAELEERERGKGAYKVHVGAEVFRAETEVSPEGTEITGPRTVTAEALFVGPKPKEGDERVLKKPGVVVPRF